MKPVRKLFISGVCLSVMQSVLLAEDWPQWRGLDRAGVWRETNILQTFPVEGLRRRWSAPAGGGYSSPVIARGRVYLLDSVLEKPRAQERLRSFDAKSGKVLWTHSIDVNYPEWGFDPKNPAGPNATCIVDEGRIFSIGATGNLFCLDARRGIVVWGKNLTQEYGLRDYAAVTPSPLIEGNMLITVIGGDSTNSCVAAFDKRSGKEKWRALNDSWTYSSPAIITSGGKRQLIIWTQKAVNSLEPASGKIFWREELTSPGDCTVATPVFERDFLLIAGLMMKLGPDVQDRRILWPESRGAPLKRLFSNTSTPVLQNGRIYSATTAGPLVCVDALSGRKIWETNSVTSSGNGSSIHITPNGGSMLLYSDQGNLIRAKVDESGYREISRAHLLDPVYPFNGRNVTWSPPSYANHCVFVRNEREIICVPLTLPPKRK